MWLEIFKFELRYRLKRPETYVFFLFLLAFGIVGVDFIFQGIELGGMKKNSPLVIAKTMGAITGIFMIMASMIMGVPILRDKEYKIEGLYYSYPLTKYSYLWGRYLGSMVILVFVFSGLLWGMMLGALMPWHSPEVVLPFNASSFFRSFTIVVLPTLFFGGSLFFVTGMLSKKLLVVYTQGIVLFVVFLLTKSITNEYLQGLLDPFSLTTLTQVAKEWSLLERSSKEIYLNGILLHNTLLWIGVGVLALLYGFQRFSFRLKSQGMNKRKIRKLSSEDVSEIDLSMLLSPSFEARPTSKKLQFLELTKFYLHSLLKEPSFWAIVICGIIIIIINSINLGTIYGVDSYPATHFIVAELQEMSLYFFIAILLFYSGELVWKERAINQHLLNDATSIPNVLVLSSKFLALNLTYIVLMLCLMVSGVFYQISQGFYEFKLDVYFIGFFVEIFPFLLLYTCVAFFFQVLSRNKFLGILLTLIFFIITIGSEALGYRHVLYKFGGQPLGPFSAMNGFGHFLTPYLWIKGYWLAFGCLALLISALIMRRGVTTSFRKRLKHIPENLNKKTIIIGCLIVAIWLGLGSYIFYNTNVLNEYWSSNDELAFRTQYERELKPLEYFPQPKITAIDLEVELYPLKRSYELKGRYELINSTNKAIKEIHIQKRLASHLQLKAVKIEGGATVDHSYDSFGYTIYRLTTPLEPQASIQMNFEQSYTPKGFEHDVSDTQLVYNGTFLKNSILPSFGYNRKYELQELEERKTMGLAARLPKAKINDSIELLNARSGEDSYGITLDITIGTHKNQKAVAPGTLINSWSSNNRNYFQYRSKEPIINFYSIVSAEYEVYQSKWKTKEPASPSVDLEIYHHQTHTYNLDRMMNGMKKSLDYYTKNFGPYPYQELRIMEVPRYADYAQSLPNTIPFSEDLGFVLAIDDEKDVDMAFYITAHEVAHQWFGMQIEAANVQGKNFVLETLAQYAALMVLKANTKPQKVKQFLKAEQERYEDLRKRKHQEPSLALVANEDYIYYHKGVLAMYRLQEMIGEEKVNRALRRFIADWNSTTGKLKKKTHRYATSRDVLSYFKEVTPMDLHDELYRLFETNDPIVLNTIKD